MELQLKKIQLPINETVIENQAEQAVDCDINLPDYCPNIQRILHCEVNCFLGKTYCEAQRLNIEGEVRINVIYLSDKGVIRAVEQKQNFVKSFDSKITLENPQVQMNYKINYVNCRAVSSRKIEIRSAILLKVKAINCAKTEVVESCEGNSVQQKKENFNLNFCNGNFEQIFSVKDELDIGNRQPISQILSTNVQAVLLDYKVISGKIVAKGELKLKVLYMPLSPDEKEIPQELEYTLPISQILSADCADDDDDCCVNFELISYDLQAKPDSDAELKILELNAQVKANIIVYKNENFNILQDCYSTNYPMNIEEKEFSFLNFEKCISEEHRIKEVFENKKSAQKILYFWSKVNDENWQQNENEILIKAQIVFSALVLDSDGNMQLLEENLNLQHKISCKNSEKLQLFNLKIKILETEALLNSLQLELRFNLQLCGILYSRKKQNLITNVTLDENVQKPVREDCSLCIYYAEKAESIWNIAKKYNSSVEGIMQENTLESDVLPQRTLLLIPLC